MGLETQWICSDERHYGPFECTICQTIPEPDSVLVTSSGCSHVFCQSCLVEWISNHSKSCPTCNQDLSYGGGGGGSSTSGQQYQQRNRRSGGGSMTIGDTTVMVERLQYAQPLAYRLLCGIKVKCPLSKHVGCTWEGDYADLQSHLVSSTAHTINNNNNSNSNINGNAGNKISSEAQPIIAPTGTPDNNNDEPMDIDDDNDDTKEEEDKDCQRSAAAATQEAALQMAITTASAIKEEANSKFETRRYNDAQSLYSKAISILEEQQVVIDEQQQQQQSQHGHDEQSPSRELLSVLYSNRAATKLSMGQYQECIDDCLHVVKTTVDVDKGGGSNNNNNNNMALIGKVYVRACRAAIQLGQLEDAASFAQRGLDAGSSSNSSSSSSSATVLQKELHTVQTMQTIVSQATDAIHNHRYADAKSYYGQLLMISPSALSFLLGAAQSDCGLGLTDSALRLTKRILLKYPKSSQACWVRGQTLFLMNEGDMGLKLIQEGLRLDPDQGTIRLSYRSLKKVHGWMNEAKQYIFRRQFQNSIDRLTNCIDECTSTSFLPTKSPLFATLHTDRAEAYLRLKQYNDAIKDCAKVVYAQEGYIPAWLIRIQAHHGLDDHDTAMEDIKYLLQRFEQDERLRKAYEKADFLIRKKARVDYYTLFGVSSIASEMEIKKAYKKKSLEYHPDRISPSATDEQKNDARRKFQLLGEGLEILCDDFQRKLYDDGYDPAAIRERVEAAKHAAQNHRNRHGYPGGYNGGGGSGYHHHHH